MTKNIMNNEIKTATKRQLWALFCITKTDYRDKNLTYDEASNLIKELGDPNYVKKPKVEGEIEAAIIMKEAVEAGNAAIAVAKVIPMVVEQHVNMVDDNSPVAKNWLVADGACGFAWINFKANTTPNRKFLAGLKKAGLCGEHKEWGKAYTGGYSYWVGQGNQSIQKKEAFARAFADVLKNHGITCYVGSRLD